jgi:hypothetical protein
VRGWWVRLEIWHSGGGEGVPTWHLGSFCRIGVGCTGLHGVAASGFVLRRRGELWGFVAPCCARLRDPGECSATEDTEDTEDTEGRWVRFAPGREHGARWQRLAWFGTSGMPTLAGRHNRRGARGAASVGMAPKTRSTGEIIPSARIVPPYRGRRCAPVMNFRGGSRFSGGFSRFFVGGGRCALRVTGAHQKKRERRRARGLGRKRSTWGASGGRAPQAGRLNGVRGWG